MSDIGEYNISFSPSFKHRIEPHPLLFRPSSNLGTSLLGAYDLDPSLARHLPGLLQHQPGLSDVRDTTYSIPMGWGRHGETTREYWMDWARGLRPLIMSGKVDCVERMSGVDFDELLATAYSELSSESQRVFFDLCVVYAKKV